MLAMLVICGLCVTSCGSDKEEEEGGGGGGGKTYVLGDYVETVWVLSERVGNSLIVEMTFINRTDHTIYGADLQLTGALSGGVISDDLGNKYYTDAGAATKVYLATAMMQDGEMLENISNYSNEWKTLNIPAGASASYIIKIVNFDPSARAGKIIFDAVFKTASGLPVQTFNMLQNSIPVNDNRVRFGGAQTPDLYMDVQVTGTSVETYDDVDYLTVNFSIKNNTVHVLQDFMLGIGEYADATDDRSNSYYWRDNMFISLNNSDYNAAFGGYNATYYNGNGYFGKWCKMSIPAGATVPASLCIKDFDPQSNTVTFDLRCSSANYEPVDDKIHFISIPVQR